jgi:aminoglycoside 6-adenylyltransferase
MRSEQQILDLIIETARDDDRIRAAMLNGSRANPNAPRDPFQDYDVVYFARDVAPFRCNYEWIERFGELMILQEPEEMGDPPAEGDRHVCYLMQFMDGNRIDLSVYDLASVDKLKDDSLTVVLLDKDGLLGGMPPPSESGYLPQPPTAKQFADCCNEFWWVSPYVAKGLWRREIINGKYFQEVVREQLDKMVRWHTGVRTGFTVSPGKYGKYWERYLEPENWGMLLRTYSGAGYDETWEALFAMGDLFRVLAKGVARHFGYEYPDGDDRRVSAHLRHVRQLPGDAQEIY